MKQMIWKRISILCLVFVAAFNISAVYAAQAEEDLFVVTELGEDVTFHTQLQQDALEAGAEHISEYSNLGKDELSIPEGVTLEWVYEGDIMPETYTVLLSQEEDLSDPLVIEVEGGSDECSCTIQNLMLGNWGNALRYMLPLLAFAAGVFLTERIEYRYKSGRKLHWRQVVLLVELLLLGVVGFMPTDLNIAANMIVSFTCAMQVQAFRKVHGYGYASTMCIGNLRSGTESLSQYLRNKEAASLRKALHFFGIILIFALGAGIGGVLSGIFFTRTIWISMLLLTIVTLMMARKNL